jgi:hypothetical protein
MSKESRAREVKSTKETLTQADRYMPAYSEYKKSAQVKGITFTLTPKQVQHLIKQNCYYCGQSPVIHNPNSGYCSYIGNGIDRVDNDLGYSVDNCVPCCSECNYGKKAKSRDDFIAWITRVYKHIYRDMD